MADVTNTTIGGWRPERLPESRDSALLEQMRAALSGACRMADRLARECGTTIASDALGDVCNVLDATIGELEAAADAAAGDEEPLRVAERAAWYGSNGCRRA